MSLHDDFSAALLAADSACPTGLASIDGADPLKRFAVYRNNVRSSLINALADSYPVTRQLVGDEFFFAMAHVYVQASPPDTPLLVDYGDCFADFIQGFSPAASVPYLSDMARLERLRVQAYHAADAVALSQQSVLEQFQNQADAAGLCLHLHPSLATLASRYAVVALWAAHQTDAMSEALDPMQAQSALVLRTDLTVHVFAIDDGCRAFIQALKQLCPLNVAMACALDACSDFDMHHCLALLIRHGAITYITAHP